MPNTLSSRTAVLASLDADAGVERDAKGDVVAFRLFRAGLFHTDYGETIFDDEAARAVVEERNQRGNRYSIDFDHKSIDPNATPEQRRAAGSFDIQVRNGELWAVDVRWTDEALRYVRAGQYLSVSPAWNQGNKTGRVISLMNCALTSNPATHGAVRLAASRTQVARIARVLAARKAGAAADDVEDSEREGTTEGEDATPRTIEQIIEALRVIASDRNAEPDDSEKARAMLEAIQRDQDEEPEVRNEAYRATKRVEAKRELDEKMGLHWTRRPKLEGTRFSFPTMTASEAKANRARRERKVV